MSLKQENLELKKQNKALQQLVDQLIEQLDTFKKESNLVRLETTPAEEIIDVQIEHIRQISRTRPLTLDETRALDLHLKNKRFIDEKNEKTIPADYTRLPSGVSEDKLLRIAESAERNPKKRTNKKTSSKNSVE